MTAHLEYLAHCPDRETFIYVMGDLLNPLNQEPLAVLDEDGNWICSEGVRIDEIGPAVKGGVYDGEGNEIEAPTVVPGHHVNLWAVGRLADLLIAGGGWEAIFPLLGNMEEMPPTEDGVPPGWQGTSGMRIYRPEAINNRVRRWALPEAA